LLFELYPEVSKRSIINGLNSYKYDHIVRLIFLKARLWKFYSPKEIKNLHEKKNLNVQEKFNDLLTGLNPEYNADLFWVDEKDPDLYPGYYDDDRMYEYYEEFRKLEKNLETSYQEFMIILNSPLGAVPKDLDEIRQLIRKGDSSAAMVYYEETKHRLENTPNPAMKNLFNDFVVEKDFLSKLEHEQRRQLVWNVYLECLNCTKLNKRSFEMLIRIIFSTDYINFLYPNQKKEIMWNFALKLSRRYGTLGEKGLLEFLNHYVFEFVSILVSNPVYQLFDFIYRYRIFELKEKNTLKGHNRSTKMIDKQQVYTILTYLLELGHYYEIYGLQLTSDLKTWSDAEQYNRFSFFYPKDIINKFLTEELYLKHLYSKKPEKLQVELKDLKIKLNRKIYSAVQRRVSQFLKGHEGMSRRRLNQLLSKLDNELVTEIVSTEVVNNVEGYLSHELPIRYVNEEAMVLIFTKLFEKDDIAIVNKFSHSLLEKMDILLQDEFFQKEFLKMLFKCVEGKEYSNFVIGLLDKGIMFKLSEDNIGRFLKNTIKSNNRAIYFSHIDQSILIKYKSLIREEIIDYLKKLPEDEREEVIKKFNLSEFFDGPVMKEELSFSRSFRQFNLRLNIFFFLDQNDLDFTIKKTNDVQTKRSLRFQNIPNKLLEEIRHIDSNIHRFLTDGSYRMKLSEQEMKSLVSKFDFSEGLYILFDRHSSDLELRFGVGEYLSDLIRNADDEFLFKVLYHNFLEYLNSQQISELLDDPQLNFLGRAITIFNKQYEKLGGAEDYFFSDLLGKVKTAVFESILRMFVNNDVKSIHGLFHSELMLQILYEEEKQPKANSYLKKLIDNPELNFIHKALEGINYTSYISVDESATNVVEEFFKTVKKLSKKTLLAYLDDKFTGEDPDEIYKLFRVGLPDYIPEDIIEQLLINSGVNIFTHVMDEWNNPSEDFWYIFDEFLDRIHKLPKSYLNKKVIECFKYGDVDVIALIFDCGFLDLNKEDLKNLNQDITYIFYKKLISLLGFEYRTYGETYETYERTETISKSYFRNLKVDEDDKLLAILRQAIKDSIGEVSIETFFEIILYDLTELLINEDLKQLLSEKEDYLISSIHPLMKYDSYEYIDIVCDFVYRLSKVASKDLWIQILPTMSNDEEEELLEKIIDRFKWFKHKENYVSIVNLLAESTGNDVKWVFYNEERHIIFNDSLKLSGKFDIGLFQPKKHIESLKKLFLYSFDESDIGSLTILQNLHELEITNSKLCRIEGIKLVNLKRLNLTTNHINIISGLEDLLGLEELLIAHNKIENIEGLEKLINLKLLDLSFNKIREITELESLKNIENLNLHSNEINEIKGLDKLIKLKILKLGYNPITEIEGFNTLNNLKELSLSGTKITKIKGLENLENLEKLDMPYKSEALDKYTTIMGCDGKKYVEYCKSRITREYGSVQIGEKKHDIFDNSLVLNNQGIRNIKDIIGLERLINLRVLDLSDNYIDEINGLETLINLEALHLYGNQIDKLTGLKHLKKLRLLRLGNMMRSKKQNYIETLDGAELPPNLERLDISYNEIKRIINLEKLQRLEYMNLDDNNISTSEGLENLSENLEKFYINQNPIPKEEAKPLWDKYLK